jgi:hypothetical protein
MNPIVIFCHSVSESLLGQLTILNAKFLLGVWNFALEFWLSRNEKSCLTTFSNYTHTQHIPTKSDNHMFKYYYKCKIQMHILNIYK